MQMNCCSFDHCGGLLPVSILCCWCVARYFEILHQFSPTNCFFAYSLCSSFDRWLLLRWELLVVAKNFEVTWDILQWPAKAKSVLWMGKGRFGSTSVARSLTQKLHNSHLEIAWTFQEKLLEFFDRFLCCDIVSPSAPTTFLLQSVCMLKPISDVTGSWAEQRDVRRKRCLVLLCSWVRPKHV